MAAPLLALFLGPLGYIAIGQWRRAAVGYAAAALVAAGAYASVWLVRPRLFWVGVFGLAILRIAMAVDVTRLKRLAPLPRAWIILIVAVGVGTFYEILTHRFVEAFQIPSGSMYPTIEIGDHLLIRKTQRGFGRGDLVVFRFPVDPSIDYVKRIVAVGGDTIAFDDAGQMILNGRPVERRRLDEPCAIPETSSFGVGGPCTVWEETLDGRTWRVVSEEEFSRAVPTTTVPAGQFFVVGDNRDNSADSRVWGFVREELIKGKPSFLWWSAGPQGTRWERVDQPLR